MSAKLKRLSGFGVEYSYMIFLLSPAKTLDCTSDTPDFGVSQPDFIAQSQSLVDVLSKYPASGLSSLMSISNKLAEQNYHRFQRWNPELSGEEAKAAAYMFKGDVYSGLDIDSLNDGQVQYVNRTTRILSGLYGLLRPLDVILPYRLEMGTKLVNEAGKDLYAFWKHYLAQSLNQSQTSHIVNLASNEYFKAIDQKQLQMPVLNIQFKDWKNDQYKIISFYAKKARGMMVAWAAKHNVSELEQLQQFDAAGYQFNPSLSQKATWTFTRKL